MSRARHLTTLALLLAGAGGCATLVDGYFLADDFVQLANFARWSGEGRLGDEVLRRFAGSIDGANAFWRPLTYATFAANYAAGGADARGWLAVNLALHLANAVLVGLVVARLARDCASSFPALFAGALFFSIASGWEVALWVAARYDALATFFVLLAAWLYAGGRRRLALAAAVVGLASKESGAVAVVMLGALALARAGEAAPPGAAPARHLVARLWPLAVVGLAYVALRLALFGTATRAYSGAPVDLASAQYWLNLWDTGLAWARAVFPGGAGMRAFAAASAGGLLVLGLLASRARPVRSMLVAVLATLAVTCALMLTHLPGFDPSGIGGRLVYLPGALLAIALGLSLAAWLQAHPGPMPGARGAGIALALLALVPHVIWMWRAAGEYHALHRQMRSVVAGIAEAATATQEPFTLVLIPDALGRAPFGRNAQAGLMLPPVQARALTRRVLVQLDTEIPELAAKVARGLFDWLPRHDLFDLPPGEAPLAGMRAVEPAAYACWNPAEHRFRRMAVGAGERDSLVRRVEAAHTAAGCRARPGP